MGLAQVLPRDAETQMYRQRTWMTSKSLSG